MKLEGQLDSAEVMRQRALELEKAGLELSQAWTTAWLEHRVGEWPKDWGADLQILIYGDFEQPQKQLHFPSLGITVHPEPVETSVVRNAACVLKATVTIQEKSVPMLIDAARRINILLGSWTLVTWGNSPIRWWSWLTHDTGAGVRAPLDHQDLTRAVEGVQALPDNVRRRIDAALYWIREPRNLLTEFHRRDLLRVYVAYWNAFECLVDAVDIIQPQKKLTPQEKQQRIDEYLAELSHKPTAQDIENCFRNIVDLGFVGKATYALQVCFGANADRYIHECFGLGVRRDRLYAIRNAISHGDVDAENLEELIRTEARLEKLWLTVWGMFGRLVPFPAPVDRHQDAKLS